MLFRPVTVTVFKLLLQHNLALRLTCRLCQYGTLANAGIQLISPLAVPAVRANAEVCMHSAHCVTGLFNYLAVSCKHGANWSEVWNCPFDNVT